jgi:hypothetical protein
MAGNGEAGISIEKLLEFLHDGTVWPLVIFILLVMEILTARIQSIQELLMEIQKPLQFLRVLRHRISLSLLFQ